MIYFLFHRSPLKELYLTNWFKNKRNNGILLSSLVLMVNFHLPLFEIFVIMVWWQLYRAGNSTRHCCTQLYCDYMTSLVSQIFQSFTFYVDESRHYGKWHWRKQTEADGGDWSFEFDIWGKIYSRKYDLKL